MKDLFEDSPDERIMIGGLAVFLHAMAAGAKFYEATHDADFYLSHVGYALLRDKAEVTSNRRLGK